MYSAQLNSERMSKDVRNNTRYNAAPRLMPASARVTSNEDDDYDEQAVLSEQESPRIVAPSVSETSVSTEPVKQVSAPTPHPPPVVSSVYSLPNVPCEYMVGGAVALGIAAGILWTSWKDIKHPLFKGTAEPRTIDAIDKMIEYA